MIRKFIPKKIKKMLRGIFKNEVFTDSANYWQERYKRGGNSGTGSYNILAEFKSEIINSFLNEYKINSTVEYGCGDGNQLKYYNFNTYCGYDVSYESIKLCTQLFKDDKTKVFKEVNDYKYEVFDLGLSIDVIYHLVEDDVFNEYMNKLFNGSCQYIIIYSSNTDFNPKGTCPHVREREFTKWVDKNATNYKLIKYIKNKYPYNGDEINSSISDFYIYIKNN